MTPATSQSPDTLPPDFFKKKTSPAPIFEVVPPQQQDKFEIVPPKKTPAVLPANFFDKQTPDALPPDFFEKKSPPKTQFEKERTEGDRGLWSGIKESIGADQPPKSPWEPLINTLKDPGTYLGPGYGLAKTAGETLWNAPRRAMEAWKDPVLRDPRSKLGFAAASVLSPLVGINPESMRARAERADTGGIIGQAAIPTSLAVAPLATESIGLAAKSIGPAVRRIPGNIGNALRTDIPGKGGAYPLKPSVKTAATVGGMAVGGVGGHALGVPAVGELGGAYLGARLGPKIADMLIPQRSSGPAGLSVKIPTRFKPPVEQVEQAVTKPATPFWQRPGFRRPGSAAPAGVPSGRSYEALPKRPTLAIEPIKDLGLPGKKGLIVDPESVPPDVKVTYQSVPQSDLLRMVRDGDTTAIAEWQRRGLELPENVGFMVESGAGTKPWRNYPR